MSLRAESQIKALEFAKELAIFIKDEKEKKGLTSAEIYYAVDCVIKTLPSPHEPMDENYD